MSGFSKQLSLANFGISPHKGFLPSIDPLTKMPSNWGFLDELGRELPGLIKTGKIVQAVTYLPIPEPEALASLFMLERERAMMTYSFAASGFIHSSKPSRLTLPRELAIPLYWLSEQFGKPPILSYCSYALNNWARIDPLKDITVDNLRLQQNFIETYDENWFILIHVDIENKAAAAITGSIGAISAAKTHDPDYLIFNLKYIGEALDNIIKTLRRMPEHCSLDVYFQTVRPWIMFFENVVYEGVQELGGTPQSFRGETGAQSSILPLLDGALGVYHEESPLTKHLEEMRLYMPPSHRALIAEVEKRSTIREAVLMSGSGELKDLYNYNLEKIYEFRDIHLGYAKGYISDKTVDPRGTGKTIFLDFLIKMRDETKTALLT